MERKASSYFDTHYLVFTSTRISDFISSVFLTFSFLGGPSTVRESSRLSEPFETII